MRFRYRLGLLASSMLIAGAAQAGPLKACRVPGMETEVQCGSVQRPLDPAKPQGTQIEIHYIVVPAMARNKQPDPVLFIAGGPGQSSINIASVVMDRLARLNNRRDLVFVDQRGTGLSAPLQCPDEDRESLAKTMGRNRQFEVFDACRQALQSLPYGDLRMFTTTIAMQDMDAVREQLGAEQWNVIGGSYGTRAALEYLRQFPSHVRRTVIDGVAPPDMVLPESFSADNQAALDAMFKGCEADKACAARYPKLRDEWQGLLASLPRQVNLMHPLTGASESVEIGRYSLLSLVRSPLYGPAAAALLPAAIHEASQGRFGPLMAIGASVGSSRKTKISEGMHFSVVCAEDVPRMGQPGAGSTDFGRSFAEGYERICRNWPRGDVPAAFYTVPPSPSPVLLLSGGADPVTPPRHAERMAKALGATNASLVQHVVVPESGHGVMGVPCVAELIFRFIDAKTDGQALPQDAACAVKIPRPLPWLPPELDKPGTQNDAKKGQP
ncbi:MAG: alpha/beta hydrolase [Paucibacter sp.]|nr:alpha/beta hydrolase [Roseateles sp.]